MAASGSVRHRGLACAAALKDIRTPGRRLARSIPDKAGGEICALFSYAWAAWKFGVAAFVMMFVVISIDVVLGEAKDRAAPSVHRSALLWFAGFVASASLTAAGLVKAFRSRMRVWIGEGINQARTLMLAMLIVGFTVAVLVPTCFLLSVKAPRAADADKGVLQFHARGLHLHHRRTRGHPPGPRLGQSTHRRRPARQVRAEGADGGEVEFGRALGSNLIKYWSFQ